MRLLAPLSPFRPRRPSPARRRRPRRSCSATPTGSSRRARSRRDRADRAGRPAHGRRRGARRRRASQEGAARRPILGRERDQELRRDRRHAARRRGRLGWTTRWSELLPGRIREGRRIRLRHLLDHTSGIPDYMRLEPWSSAVARNPRDGDPGAPARLVGRRPPARVRAGEPGLVLEHELPRARRDPGAGHGAAARRLLRGAHLRAARPARDELRERASERSQRPRSTATTSPSPAGDVSRHGLGGPWADGAIVSSARDLAVFFGAFLRAARPAPARRADERDRPGLARRGHGPGPARIAVRPLVLRTHRRHARQRHGRRGLSRRPHAGRLHRQRRRPAAMQAIGLFLDDVLCRR